MRQAVFARSVVWRQAALTLTLVFGVFGALYWETAASMVSIWWRSETFAHGFLVLPIVVWLIWRRRYQLAAMAPVPNAWAMVLLAGAGFVWLLGVLAAVNVLSQLAWVAMLVLVVLALLGRSAVSVIVFALAYLFFCVPFGEFAMPQLMQWTADITVLALRASGVPVYREGLQFVIPSGSWSVIEACSGVRYIIASLTVGTLFAYLSYQSVRRRVVFMGVSMVVPVVANWVRAYLIVMLGHLSGNTIATGVDHLIYGWVFFGLVMFLLFWIGARWTEPEPTFRDTELIEMTPHPTVHAVSDHGVGGWLVAGMAVVVVLALPQVARWQIQSAQAALPAPSLVAPAALTPGWSATPQPSPVLEPAFHNPSAQSTTSYGSAERTVRLFVAFYRNQNADRKLVSSDNVLVKSLDPRWAQVSSGSRSVPLEHGALTVRTAELRAASLTGETEGARLTVCQYYWVHGRLTSSDTLAKVYTALYSLLGQGDDSAVVIVYAPKGDADQGARALDAFLQANSAAIDRWLRSIQS